MRSHVLCCIAISAAVLLAATAPVQAGYVDLVTADNPFLYYHLDENASTITSGSTAVVNSGDSGVNGTYYYCAHNPANGSFVNVTSPVSTGMQFNRTAYSYGVFAGVGSQGSAYESLSSFTMEMLLNPANYSSQLQAIFATDASAGLANGGVHLNINETTVGICVIGNDNSIGPTSTQLPAGQWSHLAVTYQAGASESTTNWYVNGSKVATTVLPTAQAANFNMGAALGMWEPPAGWGGGQRYLDGAMVDEFAVYDSALSAAQIAAHATAAGFTVVPEPSAIVLLTFGVAGLSAYAWRKRK